MITTETAIRHSIVYILTSAIVGGIVVISIVVGIALLFLGIVYVTHYRRNKMTKKNATNTFGKIPVTSRENEHATEVNAPIYEEVEDEDVRKMELKQNIAYEQITII